MQKKTVYDATGEVNFCLSSTFKLNFCKGISYEGSVYLPDSFDIGDGGMRIENITIDEEYVLSGTLVLDGGGVPYDTGTYTGSVTFTVIN